MSMRQKSIDRGADVLFATGKFSTERDAHAASEVSYEICIASIWGGVVLGAVGMLLVGILYNVVFSQ